MNELVQSKSHKLLSALRVPNFSGGSFVSRMRSTTFLLLGLMTATGLTLVAIFATPQLHLLSPAPLPSEPTTSISKGKALTAEHGSKAPAPGGAAGRRQSPRSGAGFRANGGGGSAGGRSGHRGAGAVGSPQTVSSPGSGGGKGGGGQPEAAPTPVPAPAEPSPTPESVPVASPAPEKGSSGHSSSPNRSPATPSHTGVSDDHGSHGGAREAEGSAGHSAGAPSGHTSRPAAPASPAAPPAAAPAPSSSPGHSGNSGSHDHSR